MLLYALCFSLSGVELHEWHSSIPLMSRFFANQNSLWTGARWRNQTVTFGSFPAPSSPAHFGSIHFFFSFLFCFDPVFSKTPLHPLPLISARENKTVINSLWFCPSVFVVLPSFFSFSSGFWRSFRGNTFFFGCRLLWDPHWLTGKGTHKDSTSQLALTLCMFVCGWVTATKHPKPL